MSLNLLSYHWLKIQRQSGKIEFIVPYQLTDQYHTDPVINLVIPRPDFKGALLQFLIGLLQTAYQDLDKAKWLKLHKHPPDSEELKNQFTPFTEAFIVNSEGASFMQDFNLTNSELKPISSLLLEQPGENTLKNNTDHFIKRDKINGLCPICAVTALFTLQLNAPSGGQGHRTSIRGGGPLTTLVWEQPHSGKIPTLWHNLWLNILTNHKFGESNHFKLADIFPWLAATCVSDKQAGRSTTISDVHPLQMFWAMPRRIRLDFNSVTKGHCDICNAVSEELLSQYQTKNYGIDYTGIWEHPLTPYSKKADGETIPLHPQPGGIGYKYWFNLVLAIKKNSNKIAAKVVSDYLYNPDKYNEEQLSVWAFGYDIKKANARCWYETYLPLYHVEPEIHNSLQNAVAKLIEAAELALNYTKSCVKKADGDIKRVENSFWTNTESEFYIYLKEIINLLESQLDIETIYEKWWKCINNQALDLFQHNAMATLPKQAEYYKRLRNSLGNKFRKKLFNLSPISEVYKEEKNGIVR